MSSEILFVFIPIGIIMIASCFYSNFCEMSQFYQSETDSEIELDFNESKIEEDNALEAQLEEEKDEILNEIII